MRHASYATQVGYYLQQQQQQQQQQPQPPVRSCRNYSFLSPLLISSSTNTHHLYIFLGARGPMHNNFSFSSSNMHLKNNKKNGQGGKRNSEQALTACRSLPQSLQSGGPRTTPSGYPGGPVVPSGHMSPQLGVGQQQQQQPQQPQPQPQPPQAPRTVMAPAYTTTGRPSPHQVWGEGKKTNWWGSMPQLMSKGISREK